MWYSRHHNTREHRRITVRPSQARYHPLGHTIEFRTCPITGTNDPKGGRNAFALKHRPAGYQPADGEVAEPRGLALHLNLPDAKRGIQTTTQGAQKWGQNPGDPKMNRASPKTRAVGFAPMRGLRSNQFKMCLTPKSNQMVVWLFLIKNFF